MKEFPKKFNRKIIFFCPSIEDGGVEKNLVNICNYLSSDLNIILITANKDKKRLFNNKIKFISPKNNFFNTTSRLIKAIISLYLLLINFFGKKILLISFQANISAIIASKIFNSKIIIRSNSSPNFYAKNIFKRKIMKFFYSFASEVIVNSEEFKKEFKRYFNITPIRIYNLLENSKKIKKLSRKKINFSFFNKISKDYLKILTVGRLVEQKDHITILKALNIIKTKKKFKLCVIGKGSLKNKLLDYVYRNNLSKNVKFIGYKKNVYPYYKQADVFILSSLYEGLPNTLIEASFFNLFILSSNCKTGPKEILNSNKNARLFKVGDYKKLAKFLLTLKIKKKEKSYKDHRFDFNKNLLTYKKLITKML